MPYRTIVMQGMEDKKATEDLCCYPKTKDFDDGRRTNAD